MSLAFVSKINITRKLKELYGNSNKNSIVDFGYVTVLYIHRIKKISRNHYIISYDNDHQNLPSRGFVMLLLTVLFHQASMVVICFGVVARRLL